MGRESILKAFHDELWRKLEANKGTVDGLNPLEFAAVCLMSYQCEVNNGGLQAYFYNYSGDFALDTPDVMRHIGASHVALILEEANGLFGEGGPDRDRDKRWEQLEAFSETSVQRLDNLTDELREAESKGRYSGDLFNDYVASHKLGGLADK